MSDTDKSELRSKIARIADYFVDMGQPNEGQDGWYINHDKKLDELQALITQQCNQARIDERKKIRKPFSQLMAGLFAIDYYINKPFPDDPRWTPKSRFIEPRVQDVLAALKLPDAQAKETEETNG